MREGEVVDGRFELGRIIGEGRTGTVHEAFDRQAARRVALKQLTNHPNLHSAAARFEREVAIVAALAHENVVGHVSHGTAADGTPYLAMEWVDGEDLAARLARGALGVPDTIALARGIAAALAAAHARAIVHRDVKPSNVLLDGGRACAPKLADFGVARVLGAATALTGTGDLVGTPSYMAPELVRGQKDTDSLVDVFALGCVMHHCLAGRPPFEGSDVRIIWAKIVFAEAPRLRKLRDDVPPKLEALVAAMLHKDPTQRPQSAAAICDSLEKISPMRPM